MLALRLNQIHAAPSLEHLPEPEPQEGMVSVRLRAAALNHRDVWIQKGQYAGIQFPFTPGSDGAGFLGDQPVIINPGIHWGSDERFQDKAFHILGMPTDGTFAQWVQVPESQVYPMPDHLSFEEAAAIPLAGVTAYRALLRQGQCRSGERVLITGIGGGVAQWAFQFALAIGAEVWVSSGHETKLQEARKRGAAGVIHYRDPQWKDHLSSDTGFDVVIDGAGGPFIGDILKWMQPGGRIVMYGGTAGPITKLTPQILFWKQVSLVGSSMGSPRDFRDMLALISTQRITPVLDRFFPLEQGAEAYQRMASGDQTGKIILQIPD